MTRGILILCLVCFAAEAAPGQAAVPTSKPSTLQEEKRIERAKTEKSYADDPAIGPFAMFQILRIHLENKRVVVSSPLETFDQEHRVRLVSGDNVAILRFKEMTSSNAADQPRFIEFIRYDFGQADNVFMQTYVQAHPGYAQITGSWELAGEGSRDVSIIDRAEQFDDESGSKTDAIITLRVQGNDADSNETHKIELSAPDLRTLQREHPVEVEEYLRPVLKELGVQALLDVEEDVAWQVLAADAVPDPVMTARVQEILPKLDAQNFAQREGAANELKKLGIPGAIAMLKLDRLKLSAEQSMRLEQILGAFQQLPASEVARLRGDPAFLLSVMEADSPELRQLADGRLSQILGAPMPIDLQADPDTRHGQIETLRRQILPAATTQSVKK